MTGYQEILTDPSYRGQIVTMTYPEIGNYGVNAEDVESHKPHLAGFIVRERSRRASNFRAEGDLHDYLARYGIVGLEGIDTRALVRRLRIRGAMKGVLSSVDLDDARLVAKAKASPGLVGRDLVREVIPDGAIQWNEAAQPLGAAARRGGAAATPGPAAPHVVALDYGMKWNIARHLFDMGCRVTILPGTATAEEVLGQRARRRVPFQRARRSRAAGLRPADDPRPAGQEADLRHLPGASTLGPGLRGEDLQAEVRPSRGQPAGAEPRHRPRGDHHAEPRLRRRRPTSLPDDLEVTHLNLNDNTIEGMRHRTLPAFSVQYHPEASAGPHDSNYLFASSARCCRREGSAVNDRRKISGGLSQFSFDET